MLRRADVANAPRFVPKLHTITGHFVTVSSETVKILDIEVGSGDSVVALVPSSRVLTPMCNCIWYFHPKNFEGTYKRLPSRLESILEVDVGWRSPIPAVTVRFLPANDPAQAATWDVIEMSPWDEILVSIDSPLFSTKLSLYPETEIDIVDRFAVHVSSWLHVLRETAAATDLVKLLEEATGITLRLQKNMNPGVFEPTDDEGDDHIEVEVESSA